MAAHHMNKIAPVHMHSPSSSSTTSMQQFTVGKLDAGMAILLGSRASLIEFPSLLLPQDVTAGSVVEISVKRNVEQERRNRSDFDTLQRDILDTFGRLGPAAPEVRLRAVTQTSVVLEWSALQLATSTLLSLDIYRNGARLAPIPNPINNTSTKLSGLEVGAEYAFHLVLKTTAGTLTSNTIRTKTHSMTDTSGIAICFGAVDGGGPVSDSSSGSGGSGSGSDGAEQAGAPEPMSQLEALARDLVKSMGAKWSTRLQIDTTHYVCTSPRARAVAAHQAAANANGAAVPPPTLNAGAEGPVYRKALGLNIPVVRPEWIVACYEAKRMVPISAYYIDQDPPNHASVQKLLGDRASAQAGQGHAEQAQAQAQSQAQAQAQAAAAATTKEQPPLPPPSPELDEGQDTNEDAGVGAGAHADLAATTTTTTTTTTETSSSITSTSTDTTPRGGTAGEDMGAATEGDALAAPTTTGTSASMGGSMESISLTPGSGDGQGEGEGAGEGRAEGHETATRDGAEQGTRHGNGHVQGEGEEEDEEAADEEVDLS